MPNSDLISRAALLAAYDAAHKGPPGGARKLMQEAPTVGGWISVKEAANIIAELFGDDCACNFNGIDEWLPQYCEHAATDCPHTAGTTCWEQYIKYLNKKPDIGRKEGERNGKL